MTDTARLHALLNAAATATMREYAGWLLRENLDMREDCPDEDLAELADRLDAAHKALLDERDALAGEVARIRSDLRNPGAVWAATLRGEVAKLSMDRWAHCHALTAIDGWEEMTLREAAEHIARAAMKGADNG